MATTKVIKDLTEFNPGNPDYVLNATNAVTVINPGSGNQYNFNGVNGKFGLRIGTTVLAGVPSGHPIAILNDGLTGITYTGTVNEGTQNVPNPGGPLYTFYSGDVTITVTADFGVASYYCKAHGYMGGQNNLVSVYSEAGLKMPKGSAFSGTPEEAMMRCDDSQTSEGSTSVMQHYTGNNEWKNFVNLKTNVEYLVVAGGGGGTMNGTPSASGAGASGGGGAGGYLTNFEGTALALSGTVALTVGDGGVGGTGSGGASTIGGTGEDSTFASITASGGGGGGGGSGAGTTGGSSGGGGRNCSPYSCTATAASPAGQGNAGGSGSSAGGTPPFSGAGGGGGGAGGTGAAGSGTTGGAGGAGTQNNIDGNNYFYAGGGGGGANGSAGTGGSSIGGAGATGSASGSDASPANRGSGGGGSGGPGDGGAGSSGVVIIRCSRSSLVFSSGVTANGQSGGGSINGNATNMPSGEYFYTVTIAAPGETVTF